MMFLINTLVAILIFGAGYLACALRVSLFQAKDYKKDDDCYPDN